VGTTRPVAIVTGAGSGIGEATARRLVGDGHHVVAVGRRPGPLEALRDDLGADQVTVRATDMADTDAVTAMVADVVASRGSLDVLVNNAGSARQVGVAETTPQLFADTIAVNLAGPAAAITAAWPHLLAHGGGCVVNVSSLAQFDPFPGFFAYAAAKAGLHMLTVVAHNEGSAAGVRAFTVAPGVVDTALHHRLMPDGVDAELRHGPEVIAEVIGECVGGKHDALAGTTLAVVTPAVAQFVHTWIGGHPGGGITVIER
jgi:NAD(P)-dependent dehydrogenase (short-subunit alcohol dehydrogenase family)